MALFFSGFLLSLSVCLDLGTVNVALFRTGLQRGMGPAFWLGLGSCLGDLIYAGLSAMAIGFVLQFAPVRWALWLGGTAILLYLAYKMIRESMHKQLVFNPLDAPLTQSETLKLIGRGMALALSSPSALLWFATVGGSVIASQTNSQSDIVPFFAGFFVAGVLFSVVIAYIASQGRRLGPTWVRGLALASAALFLYFAIKVFVEGYTMFVV